jgi:cell division protein DivIC
MKRYLIIFKNKFVLAITIFMVYALFLDDVDIFMIFSKQSRLRQLEQQKIELVDKVGEIENMQRVLDNMYSLEKFAREERFFHKADEDVYVIEWLEN